MGNQSDDSKHDIDSLLHDLCEDRLSPQLHEHFCELLASNDQVLRQYVELMHLTTGVAEWARCDANVVVLEGVLQDLIERPDAAQSVAGVAVTHAATAEQQLARDHYRGTTWLRELGWVCGLAVCLLGIAVLSFTWLGDRVELAEEGQSRQPAASRDVPLDVPAIQPQFVAHVVEATDDVTWAENSAPFDLMLRVGLGERIAIESGILRLKYRTGAEVILHGPAVFIPTGTASGHLVAGRITGKVSDNTEADFRLSTPGAEVIDLGTVFGVAVNEMANTEVCVFDGEVEVNSLLTESGSRQPIRLLEGMSVRLFRDGRADLEANIDRDQFLSTLPPRFNAELASNEISLIDAFIDGPGMSHRLVATLDPTTGKPDEEPAKGLRYGGDSGYRLAVYSEFLDGVFIPSRRGKYVQIDSYGNTVNLPRCTGYIDGTVWARRPIPGLSFAASLDADRSNEVWEMGATLESFERLEKCRLGVIGLHSNVGISFDLMAIQSIEGQPIERFRCTLANLGGPDGSSAVPRESASGTADVRFYIDGVERSACLGLSRADGDQLADVDIDPFSRVFTIVVTDGGIDDGYDQVVLVDPTLEMAY